MNAYQTTVTTTSGRQAVGYVVFATESFFASKSAREGVQGVIGTETAKL